MEHRQEIEVSDRRVVDSLYRISTLSGNEKDPMEALEGILDEVINLFGATSASICLINANSDKLLIEVERGLSNASEGFELPMGVGITGWVALYGEPFLCPNVSEEEKYFTLDDRINSEMAAPLIEGGRTVGALNVDSFEMNAFNRNDLRLLVLMAKEASRVLENMWMIQQLRRKADQLQTLVLVGQDMSGKRELKDILRTITREALSLLDCKLSAFFLYNKEQDLLNLYSLQDRNGSRSYEESLGISDSILGTSLRSQRQVQTRDLLRTEEHHFVSLIREEKLHSMLVTPVVYENEPIGVLSLYVDRPHRFNDDEKLIASALADLGAIASENARLYGRVFDSEESLRKSERLTTLGTLAAEIAHEIRNPLMVIRLLFDSLNLVDADEAKSKDLSVIREKLDHLEQIAGRILDFGKSREAFRKNFSLHEIIQDAALLVRLKLEQSQVTLNVKNFMDDLVVYVDKGQIKQVLINLMLNAIVAMPKGGKLYIEAGCSQDGKAQILVKDTGSGIPGDLQEKIFDSFLTGTSEGTGLGLSISKRILRAHDGDLELVESGKVGTIFKIILPKA